MVVCRPLVLTVSQEEMVKWFIRLPFIGTNARHRRAVV